MQETDLRLRLRALPREIDPPRDLWPGIAGRLATPATTARPSRRPWFAALALAACLCAAVGIAYRTSGVAPGDATPAVAAAPAPADAAPSNAAAAPAAAAGDLRAELVRREAEALTRAYDAALRQFEQAPIPGPLQPALATLDRSARDIRGAMVHDPDAVFLLDQLRRTYALRLSLTQRAVTG